MYIKTDKTSNLETLRSLKAIFFAFLFLALPTFLYLTSCSPKSEIEKIVANPPKIYDQRTNQAVPASQQIQIPFHQLESDENIRIGSQYRETVQEQTEQFTSKDLKVWQSASIPFRSQTGRLYLNMDFAGQQSTRKDIDFYILPICDTSSLVAACTLSPLNASEIYLEASTRKNTDYQALKYDKAWLYYAHGFDKQYAISTGQQYLKFIIRANIPEGYDSRWIRLSFSDSPITLKQTSYFLFNQHSAFYQYFLILLPIIAGSLFLYYKQFYDLTHMIIGLSLAVLFSIHVLIWDIHYMVVSCLLLALAGVLYSFGIWLYFWIYLAGVYLVSTYAYQYYGGFNRGFFTQTGLILLFGLALYYLDRQPTSAQALENQN